MNVYKTVSELIHRHITLNLKLPIYVVCVYFPLLILGQTSVPNPISVPNVSNWHLSSYNEEFFKGKSVCGEEALNFWMQSSSWRGNPENNPDKFTKIERLLSGDPIQISAINKQIRSECELALGDANAWHKKTPQSRVPMVWIELALRVPDQLEPLTHALIRKALKELDLAGSGANYTAWINVPGSNGSNVHGYLTPLTLAPALIDDPKLVAAGNKGLLSELNHMNNTGDMGEFNLLESHWNGTASWELIKQYTPDPFLRRMSRMISERLWINRFLTWSPTVGRITGPGSRMAPSEWLGTDNERALLSTGLSKPIWLNFFFPWDGWDSRSFRSIWEQTQLEATIPDLPEYLQDIAWNKSYPNELQCLVALKHWKNYPDLPSVPKGNPFRPTKYVNYQTHDYTIGSTTSSWVVNTCVVAASAWWNNSRNPDAPIGSPERFCLLYPHYVFNGMSFLDKGNLFFDNAPDQPVKDAKGGPGGPWMREFIDYGRVGILQDRNTLLLSYTTKPGTHHQGEDLDKTKTRRASAAMFLFRWTEGNAGLYVNREPVHKLPCELMPGDWWFIEDGEVYAAVRPLKATALKGNCKTILEKRTRHIVLYQDNVSADNIEGISNEDWVKAQSGFVVEMGDQKEYGSFKKFQDRILSGKLTINESNGYDRHISYQRDDRQLEMKWHCYTEEYAMRQISGKDDSWTRFLQSPEFSVSDNGLVKVQDAVLKTTESNTVWLLSCVTSKTWVFYQSQFIKDLPVDFICPAGHFYTDKLPFGKMVIHQESANTVKIDVDANYRSLGDNRSLINFKSFNLYFDLGDKKPVITINGIVYKSSQIQKAGKTIWSINPYDKSSELGKTMRINPLR